MSASVLDWVWRCGAADPVDRMVQLRLAWKLYDGEDECAISMHALCSDTRLSESSVRRSIQRLEREGFLSVTRGVGKGNVSRYRLLKVSQGNLSVGNLSVRKVSDERSKGVTVTGPPAPPIRKRQKQDTGAASPLSLPEWLPVEPWNAWLEMRAAKKGKKPITDYALRVAIRKLDRFRLSGHDVNSLIDEAVIHSWDSFYPPRMDSTHQAPRPLSTAPAAEAHQYKSTSLSIAQIRQQAETGAQ